jgi:hypothetical protein
MHYQYEADCTEAQGGISPPPYFYFSGTSCIIIVVTTTTTTAAAATSTTTTNTMTTIAAAAINTRIVTDLINIWLDDGAANTEFNCVPTIHDHCHAMAR